MVKAAVRRKEVLAASNKEIKERCMETTKEKREKLKGVYIRTNKVSELFGRKVNEDVNGNRKFFWN